MNKWYSAGRLFETETGAQRSALSEYLALSAQLQMGWRKSEVATVLSSPTVTDAVVLMRYSTTVLRRHGQGHGRSLVAAVMRGRAKRFVWQKEDDRESQSV